MVLVLLAASLAGCVSGEPPVLEVTVSETDTAVVETYQNGVLVELSLIHISEPTRPY